MLIDLQRGALEIIFDRAWVLGEFLSNMKLKEGSVVEVCRREEGPLGSWFNARIVSGDGQRYMVEYENFLKVDRKPVIEEVHYEAVRPVPCGRSEAWKWASGDTVEVYDRHSWKVGKVVKALPSNFFVVRLLEPLQQRTCHQSNIRPRLFWQGSRWFPIQQEAEAGKFSQ